VNFCMQIATNVFLTFAHFRLHYKYSLVIIEHTIDTYFGYSNEVFLEIEFIGVQFFAFLQNAILCWLNVLYGFLQPLGWYGFLSGFPHLMDH
jgi:hypothetical protein